MAKFSRHSRLPKQKIQEIIIDLCEAIAATRDSREAARLLTDLLGKQELEMIAKRLRIAELILDNYIYVDIEKELKVSPSTIARVQVWLQSSGEGYRTIIERTKSKRKLRKENDQPHSLRSIKKKYPMYFWPQILLENWVKSATQKEKAIMKGILEKLDKKVVIYKNLESLLKKEAKIVNK